MCLSYENCATEMSKCFYLATLGNRQIEQNKQNFNKQCYINLTFEYD